MTATDLSHNEPMATSNRTALKQRYRRFEARLARKDGEFRTTGHFEASSNAPADTPASQRGSVIAENVRHVVGVLDDAEGRVYADRHSQPSGARDVEQE